MAQEDRGQEHARDHDHLLAENRLLAQRYLELENDTRRQIEKLRGANALLTRGDTHIQMLLENAAIGFALLDLNMRIVSANPVLCSLLGYGHDELTGENINNYVYVGNLSAFSRMTGQAAGTVQSNESIEMVAKDGRLVPCRLAVSDWLDNSGALRGSFVLVFGIGNEVRAVARLREVETAMATAEKSRSLFLEVVARELRTPASGIMGMIRMLMDADLSERQAELAGVIHSSASSLVKLVDDIVDVVRADAGELRSVQTAFNPWELSEGVTSLFSVRADEKGVELRVHVSASVPERVAGDVSLLRRVLVHLLDNALKFTDHGHVALTVDVIGDSLRFMVSDTGAGVAADPGRDIFGDGEFQDSPESRRHGGVGVGLSLSRRLVGLMGGRIGYESEPGRGSEFHFNIPLVVPAEAPVGEVEPPPEALRLPPLSILLADGNPLSRRVVRAYLQFDGHQLTVAESGLEAADKCRTGRFDVALLDLHLPKLDAIQTLRIIRDDEKTGARARLPALILSPAGKLREDGFYQRAGADGVVSKPTQPVELMAAIAAATCVEPLAVARQRTAVQYAAESSGGSLRRIDGSQLVNLRQVMLNDQFLGILRFFMEDAVPGIIDLAPQAEQENPDRERIAFSASKARGLAGYLGFTALADLLKRLENAGRTQAGTEALRALAAELPVTVDDTLEELKRILPEAFATISAMNGSILDEAGETPPRNA